MALIFEREVGHHIKGLGPLRLFLDDCLMVFESEEAAEEARQIVETRLGAAYMELSDKKSDVHYFDPDDPNPSSFDFLAFQRRGSLWLPSRNAQDGMIMSLDKLARERKHKLMPSFIDGWRSYFQADSPALDVFGKLDNRIKARFGHLGLDLPRLADPTRLSMETHTPGSYCKQLRSGTKAPSKRNRSITKREAKYLNRLITGGNGTSNLGLAGNYSTRGKTKPSGPKPHGGRGICRPSGQVVRFSAGSSIDSSTIDLPEMVSHYQRIIQPIRSGIVEQYANSNSENFLSTGLALELARDSRGEKQWIHCCAVLGIRPERADQIVRGASATNERLDWEERPPPPEVLWKLGLVATQKLWRQLLFDGIFEYWRRNEITPRQICDVVEAELIRARKWSMTPKKHFPQKDNTP